MEEIINETKEFKYLGKLIIPHKKFRFKDYDHFIKNVTWKGVITEKEGWNYEEFYSIAKQHGAGQHDIFRVDGVLMVFSSWGLLVWTGRK